MFRHVLVTLIAGGAAALSPAAPQHTVAIAAAANLTYVLEAVDGAFAHEMPGVALRVSTGASGNLYAQIGNGAPFDVFLSADTEYAERLAKAGAGDARTLTPFAVGRLVLWTTRADLELTDIAAVVRGARVKKLAIAQPKTAPYGRAAEEALGELHLAAIAGSKLVIGENISQTAQFVATGNADAGFVALSLLQVPGRASEGRWIEVPPELYPSARLDHVAILTRRGADNPAAQAYLRFLRGPAAREIFHAFGYGPPGNVSGR